MKSLDVLGKEGLLSQVIEGFIPRESQQTMAQAIERAIGVDAQLVVEAGTGTGKTFGYLVPAFLAQKKTIISTGTRNLQDQLFFKDIPTLTKLLPASRKIVLLKGRANYVCRHRLQRHLADGRFASRQHVAQLQDIYEWSLATVSGDIAELTSIPEDTAVWSYATSTADNCLNQECPFYKDCFVVKVRQEALAADILVINHHLFFADLVLQAEGFGELLPGADVIIFDEAHHLPEVASLFFSTTLSSRQLLELARDSETEGLQHAKDTAELMPVLQHLQQSTQHIRATLGDESRRLPWPEHLSVALQNHIQNVKEALENLEAILKIAGVRSEGLENCWRRTAEMIQRFNLLTGKAPDNMVHWYETYPLSFSIQLTPMIIAEHFKQFLAQQKKTWIFTSATLTVKNSFRVFVEAMGLDSALQLQLKSPFDYQKQALLYVPRGLPDPQAYDYTQAVLDAAIPVLETVQGKTFLLFTSYRALQFAADYLKERIAFPLLIQGSLPKRQLVEKFVELGNAVLLGTSSFWYGVDVRGDALSCVIIDKLPFAAPDDPILQAKIQLLRRQGIDPFTNIQLPQAVLILKQGAGRLIRDITDKGILMICDPRLIGARYGEIFLRSLPNMARTRDLEKVRDFFFTTMKPEVVS